MVQEVFHEKLSMSLACCEGNVNVLSFTRILLLKHTVVYLNILVREHISVFLMVTN